MDLEILLDLEGLHSQIAKDLKKKLKLPKGNIWFLVLEGAHKVKIGNIQSFLKPCDIFVWETVIIHW